MQADLAMDVIRTIRNDSEIQNVKIAAFVNELAHDYSVKELNALGVFEMDDRMAHDFMPKQVVEKTKSMLGIQ